MGMQDVVEIGTAKVARIPGINVCAKTGTAEVYRIENGKRVKLKDNSMFVCFAPRENPKIAIAVIVENAGFGATWAGPIARLMMEKYLNDTLQAKSKLDSARISSTNLMPSWLVREQYREDSIRAQYWFKLTKDSNYIKKFIRKPTPAPVKKDSSAPKPPTRVAYKNQPDIIEPREKFTIKKKSIA
jgi:penicillin-binding protein 2